MKQRINNIMERMLLTSSASKLNASGQAVVENARLTHKKTSCLQDILNRFPVLDTAFKEYFPLQTFEEQSTASFDRQSENLDQSSLLEEPNEKVAYLKQVYINYTPALETQEQMRRIVDSFKDVNRNSPTNYVKDIYAAYQKRGGERTFEQLEGKLQADLIFLIKRENESKQRMEAKYRS